MPGGFAGLLSNFQASAKNTLVQQQAKEEPSTRFRPSGAEHGVKIKYGILSKQVQKAAGLAAKMNDQKTTLVRAVFGDNNNRLTAAGIVKTQSLAFFRPASGGVDAFDYSSQMHQSMSRSKAIGILSHLRAQRNALVSYVQESKFENAIVAWIISSLYSFFMQISFLILFYFPAAAQ